MPYWFKKRKRRAGSLKTKRPSKRIGNDTVKRVLTQSTDVETITPNHSPPKRRGIQTLNDDLRQEENDILFPKVGHDQVALNYSVAYYFVNVLLSPPKKEWYGQEGTISAIINTFNIKESHLSTTMNGLRRKIERILCKVVECSRRGVMFDGYPSRSKVGRKLLIEEGSIEECIIADRMESGLGVRMTTAMVNQHRMDEGLEPVCHGVVADHIHRMNSRVTSLEKKPQGSNDNTAWVNARHGQTLQAPPKRQISAPQ